MGEFKEETTAYQKEQKGSSHICQKDLDVPQDFWEIFLRTDEIKAELLVRVKSHYIWCTTNTTFHKTIITTVNHGGGSLIAWGSFADSRTGRLAVIDQPDLPENPPGECPAITVL